MKRLRSFSAGTFLRLSEWEFREALRRSNDAYRLPHGQRIDALRHIAPDYGVSVRTLQRWRKYHVYTVKVGPYRALFTTNGKDGPVQATSWESAA